MRHRSPVALTSSLVAALSLTGCASSSDDTAGGSGGSASCLSVSSGMANAIASGAEAGTGMTAGSIAAVKSPDYAKVYFIAMRFGATGIDDQVGVWASNSLEPGQGMIMAVEGVAQQFTDWPTAANSAAEISSADPAVDDAKDCL